MYGIGSEGFILNSNPRDLERELEFVKQSPIWDTPYAYGCFRGVSTKLDTLLLHYIYTIEYVVNKL
jgi:hypothetical protein